jgi:non-homologous end joining protein Ku
MDLIRKKAKGQKLPEPEDTGEGEVIDLMAALRESVDQTKRRQKRTPRRSTKKTARRKAS